MRKEIENYKLIERNIPIYETEEELEDHLAEWIIVDGTLYSRRWADEIKKVTQ